VGKNEISRQKTEKQKQSAILFLSRFHIYQKQKKKLKMIVMTINMNSNRSNIKIKMRFVPTIFILPTGGQATSQDQDISRRTTSQTGELTTAGLAATQRATQPSLKRSP
jgi:hypothetical protein